MSMNAVVSQAVRRHGLVGCFKQVLARAKQEAGRVPYLHERHVWYRLSMPPASPPLALPAGLELIQAEHGDLRLLQQLETIGRFEAECRLSAGEDLWIVHDGAQAACAFWIFWDQAPVLAAPGGWMPLPEGCVCLEDSVTAPAYRGRGIAPAAWSQVAARLAEQEVARIITKIDESNTASRRAVEKIGFREMAVMDMERVWLMRHVEVSLRAEDPAAMFLSERLTR